MIEPLIRYFSARAELTSEDTALLRSLRIKTKSVGRGNDFVVAKSWPRESCVLLAGIAGRELLKADGSRQISALHFAGDMVDAHSFVLKQIDHSVVALTDCQVAFIPHSELMRVTDASAHLARLIWLVTAIDGAIQRAWIACIGRSSAVEQLGHLLCEIYLRMTMVGLAGNWRFRLDLTQVQVADCLGLSPVHINRSLQELRGTGYVSWDKQEVVIHDWDALAELSEFDATYLNIMKIPR